MSKNISQQSTLKDPIWRRILVFAAKLVVIFIAGMFLCYMYNRIIAKSVAPVHAASNEIELLKNEISDLRKQVESIINNRNSRSCIGNRDELRNKWKAWIALRLKIESEEPYSIELKNFCDLFSNDQEVLNLVNDLIKEISPTGGSDKIQATYKRILKKIIEFKKDYQTTLTKINGYVLSSICNCNEVKK